MFAQNPFVKATKEQAKLRLAIIGTSGTGKTYTGIQIATFLGRTAVIDTERGIARKYGLPLFDFDVLELESHHPQNYINAIKAAVQYGYEVLVIDSLSHAWSGAGGVLEMVDNEKKRSKNPNSFAAWGNVTPLQNQLVDTILSSNVHIIATLRAKTEYVTEVVNGKSVPRKVGLAPIQRDGIEYEFDVVGDMDTENNFVVTKTRCPELNGVVINKPGVELAAALKDWLGDGQPSIRLLQKPEPEKVTEEKEPPHYLTTKAAQDRLAALFTELGITKEEHAYYLQHIEDGRTLERFGETSLSEEQLHARIKALHAALVAEHQGMKPAQPKTNGNGNHPEPMTIEEQAKLVFSEGTPEQFDAALAKAKTLIPPVLDAKSSVKDVLNAVTMQLRIDNPVREKSTHTPPKVEGYLTRVFVVHDGKDEANKKRPRLRFTFVGMDGTEYSVNDFSSQPYRERGYFTEGELDRVGDTFDCQIEAVIYQKGEYWNVDHTSIPSLPVEEIAPPPGASDVNF